jgi:hypothetical protein
MKGLAPGNAIAWLLLIAVMLAGPARAASAPSVAFFYGAAAPLDELHAFDIAIVEPDHGYDPSAYRTAYSELYAYVSLGEQQPGRGYFHAIPESWRVGANTAWGSVLIDQSAAEWPDFVAEHIVAPLWNKGYQGLFLDTLDAFRLAGTKLDEPAQWAGMARVIRTLRQRFPGIRLITNRGFELLPEVAGELYAIAGESLFRGWNASTRRYVEVPESDRQWLMAQLQQARDKYGLLPIAIDYVDPSDRDLARETAGRIRSAGFVPWVADPALASLGVGSVEVVPRRILVVYDSREGRQLDFNGAHWLLGTPLDYMGYIPEHVDVGGSLPEPAAGVYAGIVVWLGGGVAAERTQTLARWLRQRIERGMKVAVLRSFGFGLDASSARWLGLEIASDPAPGRMELARSDPMFGFEAQPAPIRQAAVPIRLAPGKGEPLLTISDSRGARFDAAALTPWGGYALTPFVIVELPGTDKLRWVVDPFAFLARALRLPPLPVPDTTTENGRRLLFAHIDGDGFPSRAEFPGSPLAAEVLLKEVLQRYRVPTTMSVIEAEVSPTGLHPDLAPLMEQIARQMFALPHVEAASHTYSHPFRWESAKPVGGVEGDDYYHLAVPGYRFDPRREVAGSRAYVERLVPPGKPVKIMLWSGSADPDAFTLRLAEDAGMLNMNGGNTAITRGNASLTAVWPLGIRKGGLWHTYAPVMNENVYTNLWHGPFYGYERVIETFELTDKPRRLKPIDIYYHTYSASKLASLKALRKVYDWALNQPTMPVFASEYIRKTLDFQRMVLARSGDGWLVRGAGALRTLRVPPELGPPDVAASTGVAGFADAPEGRYIHLTGSDAHIRFGQAGRAVPYLAEANARLTGWERGADGLQFALDGHAPIEFSLANALGCRVRTDGKPVTAKSGGALARFKLSHAAAKVKVSCGER